MRRFLVQSAAALAGIAILAIALIGFRLSQGGVDYSAYAHVVDLTGDTTVTTADIHLEVDMIPGNGTSPCNPVDDAANIGITSNYKVAICLTSSGAEPAGFQFDLLYDDTLNTCVPATCTGTCLDGNPDANTGSTTFSTPDLGQAPDAAYDCSSGGVAPPKCDADTATGAQHGKATISCLTTGVPTLSVGATVSAPIAEVSFNAAAAGLDHLTLSNVAVYDPDLNNILSCPDGPGLCFGALDNKIPPTATNTQPPTDTPTIAPTATNTNTPTPTPAGIQMVKDTNPLLPGIQTTANLWLMKAGCVLPAEGKGCLEIDEWVIGANDVDNPNDSDEVPEGLGAWENQIRFDHKFVSVTKVPDLTWLLSGGRIAPTIPNPNGGDPLVNGCYITIESENSILEGCVTKDDPNNPGRLGPNGTGLIERVYVQPKLNDLIYRSDFRPTKDNGIVTDIVDDNCEVTDTQGEAIPGSLPGQLTPFCGDAHITIRMLECDLNLDCTVDVMDDQAEAFRYGSQLGLQLYDRWFDLEPKYSDDDVDIKDLQFCFGRNYSTCQAPIPDDQGTPVPPPNDP